MARITKLVLLADVKNELMNKLILSGYKILSGEGTSIFRTFIVRFIMLFALWKVLFHFIWTVPHYLEAYNEFSLDVISMILQQVSVILTFVGHEVVIVEPERLVGIVGTVGVSVGEPCIGFGIHALFVALIISYGNQWAKKWWFLLVGTSLIYILNLTRITALAIMVQYDQSIWDLNHKFIFKFIIYSVIFIFWMLWIKGGKEK